jgi:excisionase family DNA binding protein
MNNGQIEEELVVYTVPEVAGILKISDKSVYRLIERKLLKSCCALRHKRVSKQELVRFIHASNGLYQ